MELIEASFYSVVGDVLYGIFGAIPDYNVAILSLGWYYTDKRPCCRAIASRGHIVNLRLLLTKPFRYRAVLCFVDR